MNKLSPSLLLAATTLLLSASALAQSAEHDAVNELMRKTLRAFETGNQELIFQALRRDGMVIGYSRSRAQVYKESAEEWAKGFTGQPAPDEAQRKRTYQILDVSGNAALVKLTLDYPTWNGVDYLALTKIDGEWRIVTKAWSGQRKAVAQAGG